MEMNKDERDPNSELLHKVETAVYAYDLFGKQEHLISTHTEDAPRDQ